MTRDDILALNRTLKAEGRRMCVTCEVIQTLDTKHFNYDHGIRFQQRCTGCARVYRLNYKAECELLRSRRTMKADAR